MRTSRVVFFIAALLCSMSAYSQDILDAVKAGDLIRVMEITRSNPGLVHEKDSNGRTPLHWAARGVHFEIIRHLVENGADVNAADNYFIVPLFSVVTRNHLGSAEFLIRNGADLKARNSEGFTALHYACYNGLPEMAVLLVESGSDIRIQDQYRKTPILVAINGSGVIEFRKAKDLSVWTRILELLLSKGAELSADGSRGFLELTEALAVGDPETVNLLLDHGAEVPVTGEESRRLIHGSARQGMKELAELMLDRGADYRTPNPNGGTLMHSAASGGLESVVRRLFSLGMDVNQRDRYGTAPIHSAAANGKAETVRALMDLGADINLRNNSGETALNIAREKEFQDAADLLIGQGADPGPVRFPVLKGPYLGQKKPGRTPKLFAPGIVSMEGAVHGAPIFTPDGKEFFWFSWPGPITRAMRYENGSWTRPVQADNVRGNPTISPDGKRIYSFGPFNPRGIAISEKTENGWSEPKILESQIHLMNSGWEIWETSSGTIYFSSNREGGQGGDDLYRVSLISGQISEAENLGENVNSEADDWGEYGGYAAPDESFVLFSSNRSGGYGGYDLYVSFLKQDGTWTKAANLGPKINDKFLQIWPCVSPDRQFLFFIRIENGGNGEVFWVHAGLLDDLRNQLIGKGE